MRHNTITPALLVLGLLGLFGCGKPSSTSDPATSSGGNPSASDSAAPSGANPTASARQSQRASEPAPASNPPIVMGVGTRIAVTIDQTISSKNSNPGDHFDA